MIDEPLTESAIDSPFACPECRLALRFEDALRCPRCGQRYLDAGGVACFSPTGLYHGPILPPPEMEAFLALARAQGYRAAISDLAGKDPDLVRYISSSSRTGGLRLIELQGHERVLDFGCAFGVLALALVPLAALVVALDVTREKIAFLDIVKQQDRLETFFPVCNGDPLRLPFPNKYFDWVILNAVFEYLPQSIGVEDVRAAHLLALREVHRVIAPGGRLYLATKNRYSYRLWLGDLDHNGLRFTSLLPRPLAESITVKRTGRHYRTITHSFGEYRRLLGDAGFRTSTFYCPFPSLQYPERFMRLTASRRELLTSLSEVKPAGSRARVLWRLAARSGLLPLLLPQFTIVAQK